MWPSFPFTCRLLFIITTRYTKVNRFAPILSIRSVLSCFYLLISHDEIFSTWTSRLPRCLICLLLHIMHSVLYAETDAFWWLTMAFLISSEHKHRSTMFLHCCFQGYSPDLGRTTNGVPLLQPRLEDWRQPAAPALEKTSCNQESKTAWAPIQWRTRLRVKEFYQPRLLLQRLHLQGSGCSPKRTNRLNFFYRMSHNRTRGPVLLIPVFH